ncbi:hypothetical protein TRVL_09615 [Trypanosoma vivax]|nr:hypothetical protein TRVL_09615 [Trypanosoma vivax]
MRLERCTPIKIYFYVFRVSAFKHFKKLKFRFFICFIGRITVTVITGASCQFILIDARSKNLAPHAELHNFQTLAVFAVIESPENIVVLIVDTHTNLLFFCCCRSSK